MSFIDISHAADVFKIGVSWLGMMDWEINTLEGGYPQTINYFCCLVVG
jgi:hypothetical protein